MPRPEHHDYSRISNLPIDTARFGPQVLGPGGIGLQFAAKLRHINAQVLRLLGMLRTPHLL